MDTLKELAQLRKKLKTLEDKDAIRDVLTSYALNCDLCRYDVFVTLWTDDAVFITDGPGTTVTKKGKNEILSYLTGLLPKSNACTQHLQLDYIIKIKGNTATATGYQLISISKSEIPAIARCALRSFAFQRVKGKWLIKEAVSRSITNDIECQKLFPLE
jgi:ketosteroid isomerase-like protein